MSKLSPQDRKLIRVIALAFVGTVIIVLLMLIFTPSWILPNKENPREDFWAAVDKCPKDGRFYSYENGACHSLEDTLRWSNTFSTVKQPNGRVVAVRP